MTEKINLTPEQIAARDPAESFQDLLDLERVDVPDALRDSTETYLGSEDLPIERYISPEYFQKEVDKVWRKIGTYREAMTDSGEFDARRAEQAKAWMWSEIEESLIAALRQHPEVERRVNSLESEVARGERAPGAAARELLSIFLGTAAAESP